MLSVACRVVGVDCDFKGTGETESCHNSEIKLAAIAYSLTKYRIRFVLICHFFSFPDPVLEQVDPFDLLRTLICFNV